MFHSRLSLLLAAVAVAGLATSASAQIVFTGGQYYLEANVNGTPTNVTNTPAQTATFIAPTQNRTGTGLAASAGGGNTVGGTTAAVNVNTSATRGTAAAANTFAFGLSAPNNPAQGGTTASAPLGYGYFSNFSIGTPGNYNLNLDWQTPTYTSTGTGYAYSDFSAFLWDQSRNVVYALGAAKSTNGVFDFPPQLPDLSNTPAANATLLQAALGNTSLNLFPGQYQLYLQSQSYVEGSSGAQSVTTNASATLRFVSNAVPEPLSVAVFGGLAAVGGLVARRRMKATAIVPP